MKGLGRERELIPCNDTMAMHMCMCIALLHSSPPPPNSASLACLFWLLFLISRKLAVAHQDTPVCTAQSPGVRVRQAYRKLPAERCDAYGRDGAHASVRVRATSVLPSAMRCAMDETCDGGVKVPFSGPRVPRGGVTRQGVVLTDLQSLVHCQ